MINRKRLSEILKNKLLQLRWNPQGKWNRSFGRIDEQKNRDNLSNREDKEEVVTIDNKAVIEVDSPTPEQLENPSQREVNHADLVDIINGLYTEEDSSDQEICCVPVKVEDGDRSIWVQDGKFVVVDAKPSGQQPKIIPSEEIIIRVNGAVIKEATTVYAKDQLQWEFELNQKEFDIRIVDKMEVYLQLHPIINHQYHLRNTTPATCLKPEIEWTEKQMDHPYWSSKITENAHKMGIRAMIEISNLMQELMAPTYQPICIAVGTPPVESQDGFLEILGLDNEEEKGPIDKARIDYKERLKIPSVNKGDVVAILHSPIEGKNGMNVLGEPLPYKPPKKQEVKLRPSVELVEDGKIIAREDGRPSITGARIKYIEVSKVYEIHQDVDLATGNLYFSGDIAVHGDVREAMRVEASGNIFIYGNIYSAKIISSQNIFIKGNVFSSEIFAGQHGLFQSNAFQLIQKLYYAFVNLSHAFSQALQVLQAKGMTYNEGQLMASLVEIKFPEIVEAAKGYQQLINEVQNYKIKLMIEYIMLKQMLRPFTQAANIRNFCKGETLQSLLALLEQEMNRLENSIQPISRIEVNYAQNSNLRANGEVIFTESGIINSVVFAGTNCMVTETNSVIRGGKIKAAEKVMANEIGTPLGAIPKITAGLAVYAKKIHQASIRVNNETFEIDEPIREASFEYDAKTDRVKAIFLKQGK
ncbi:MAG TPA: FapA family protein [Bacillota bacterium]|nr:FapA family protein [Bacillota bacterium]